LKNCLECDEQPKMRIYKEPKMIKIKRKIKFPASRWIEFRKNNDF
jgi:hypothetical protein